MVISDGYHSQAQTQITEKRINSNEAQEIARVFHGEGTTKK